MIEKHPEAEYWEDSEGAKHYEIDKASTAMGDNVPTEEEKRYQAGHAQRSAEADADMVEGLMDAEVEKWYKKFKEKGLIPENDADAEGYSDFYDLVNSIMRYGDASSKPWEVISPEHAEKEEVKHVAALKALYEALTADDEEKD